MSQNIVWRGSLNKVTTEQCLALRPGEKEEAGKGSQVQVFHENTWYSVEALLNDKAA